MLRKSVPDDIKLGFECKTVDVNLEHIIPIKKMATGIRVCRRYRQILASIREVGIIEHPVVTPDRQLKGRYILLDGHLRIEALKEIGEKKVTCLLSTDDEAFTYNHYVNPVSPLQQHRMILRTLERGVPEEKIAKALNVEIKKITYKRNLLEGMSPKVVEILKNKTIAVQVFWILKRMRPLRQIEAVKLMNDSKIFTTAYANALLAATPKNQLANPNRPLRIEGLDEKQMARMESEMESLQGEYRLIEENYGSDVLNLTLAKGYLTSLLGNVRIVRYLAQHHQEILVQFQKIADMKSLSAKKAA